MNENHLAVKSVPFVVDLLHFVLEVNGVVCFIVHHLLSRAAEGSDAHLQQLQ